MSNNLIDKDSYALVEGVSATEFDDATFAASKITSGTLDSARLPVVPVSKGGTGATTAAGAREVINAADRWVKLWENSSISSNFNAQKIDLSSLNDDYNLFMIVYKSDWGMFAQEPTQIDTQTIYYAEYEQKSTFSKGTSYGSDASSPVIVYRRLTVRWSDVEKSFSFSNGAYSFSLSTVESAAILKPYFIFGCKI